ncbi:hypothetical protein [Granulicatella seriolae]|uniref:Uncharacterized protein n=1 Tax=Granulicatella seriolae TaxID=2967226 RepID=A0ABT1WN26_9LACT|nr:hypothetical protein [Granulicatella seriolae]
MSKTREAANIGRNWTKALEETITHVCKVAESVAESTVEFMKNVDWKKVGVAAAIVTSVVVTVATAGAAAPVIASLAGGLGLSSTATAILTTMGLGAISTAAGSGSHALVDGIFSGKDGKTITGNVLKAMLIGTITGGLIGGLGGVAANATKPLIQYTTKVAGETVIDTFRDVLEGNDITLSSVGMNLVLNAVTENVPSKATKGSQAKVEVPPTKSFAGEDVLQGVSKGTSGVETTAKDLSQFEKLKGEYASKEIPNADRIWSGLKDDPSHRAASFITEEQLAKGRIMSFTGSDNKSYSILQTSGGFNGLDGIYEYTLDSTGKITHQRFIEGGKITGFPNQKVPKGGY